jgi:hypothetical protein
LSFSASPITRHRCNPICNLLGPSSIIPRTQLIDPHALWSMRPFFSISLCPGVSINCAISGTSWIDRRLEVFELTTRSVSRLCQAGGASLRGS